MPRPAHPAAAPTPRGSRLARLRAELEHRELDAFLVTNLRNIRYLSGFSGSSAAALVTGKGAWLITDFRYRLQVAEEVREFEVAEQKGGMEKFLAGFLAPMALRRVGFESTASFGFARKLNRMVRPGRIQSVEGLVERLRVVKDPEELEVMERMVAVCQEAFAGFLSWVRPGVAEREASLELEYRMRRLGSEPPPFPLIVAAGENGALPHARPSGRKIRGGEPVIVDFGALAEGYATDMTRTFSLGEPSPELAKVYRVVYDAQESAMGVVRPGVSGVEVDRAAREVIESAGMGALFGHATGHGVGLDVHEAPGLSPESRDILLPGMVVTVEPGIYLEGRGGVRIEDMLLVTEEGHRVLTSRLARPMELG